MMAPQVGRRIRLRGRPVVLSLLAVLNAAVLAGCSSAPPDEAAESTATASSAPSSSSPEQSPTGGTASESQAPSDREALASETIELAPDYGGTLTFSVLSLTVEGELTALELELLPEADNLDEGTTVNNVISGTPESTRDLAPELLDPVNLKAYSEVEGGFGVEEGINTQVTDGLPMTFTFYYAAPQDDVDTFDVAVGSGLPTFRGVPVER